MIPDCYSTMSCVQVSHFHSEGRELCSATSVSVTTEPLGGGQQMEEELTKCYTTSTMKNKGVRE